MPNIKNPIRHKILIVSNRLPVDITKKGSKLYIRPNIGGLATALSSVQKQYQLQWVGWHGKVDVSKEIESKFNSEFNCYSVSLSKEDIKKYYLGFCNETIWPLFHYFPKITKYDSSEWNYYNKVNQMFCDKIIEIADPEDTIWIHDYHLMLLPNLLRKHLPKATIGFFLHIPFPPFEIFRLLPWRREILTGILGADLIGFHTYEYSNNFLNNILYLLGNDNELGRLQIGDRTINVGVFPLGINFQQYFDAAKNPKIEKEIRRFKNIVGEHKIILSVDRMDYTKGIPERLEAFDTFLEENRQWHGKVTMIMVVPPSRIGVHQYKLLKKEIDESIGRINGKYSTIGWSPILYIHKPMNFQSLSALYVISDVALITPIRDGMNLIAKEYIATNSDGLGVLILSEMAGAAKELGEAIIVNPNNKTEISKALNTALNMPKEEQILRNKTMQERLRFYDVEWWVKQFLEKMDETKKNQKILGAKILDDKIQTRLVNDYHRSNSRLIFLDYDGTLTPFVKSPKDANPDKEVLEILERLSTPPENEIVIVSGRDKNTLDKWFGNLNVSLVGEHGAYIKKKNSNLWETIEPLTSDWKKEIRPTLELFANRVQNSFLEEKEFSIAWHYRNVKTEEGISQAKELMALLTTISANLEIGVLHGNNVLEVKNIGINKGKATLRYLSENNFQFILAIGDDETDEALFKALPPDAYSIRVGIIPSRSRFNLNSQKEVLLLLKKLTSAK